jgi:hypothetical protein
LNPTKIMPVVFAPSKDTVERQRVLPDFLIPMLSHRVAWKEEDYQIVLIAWKRLSKIDRMLVILCRCFANECIESNATRNYLLLLESSREKSSTLALLSCFSVQSHDEDLSFNFASWGAIAARDREDERWSLLIMMFSGMARWKSNSTNYPPVCISVLLARTRPARSEKRKMKKCDWNNQVFRNSPGYL